MPRYVLVEFESNEAAERFVFKTMEREALGAKYKIIGFFAKPRNFCKCGPLSDLRQTQETQRGSKYGWLIHLPCGRPRRMGHSPRNLIDPEGTYPSRITSFLHLVGIDWQTNHPEVTILQNYPISVTLREEDK